MPMAGYSELFNRLKTMADDVPIGVDVTLTFRFHPEPPGYNSQQPILLQHTQMEKGKTSRANSTDVVSSRGPIDMASGITCHSSTGPPTDLLFPSAELIAHQNKTKQSDLYEQLKLE